MAMPELTRRRNLQRRADFWLSFPAVPRGTPSRVRTEFPHHHARSSRIPFWGPLAILKCGGPPLWRTTTGLSWPFIPFPRLVRRLLNAADGFYLA